MEKWISCSLKTKSLREVDKGTTWMRWRRKRRRRWWVKSQLELEVLELKEEEEEEEVKSLYAGKDTFFDSCL